MSTGPSQDQVNARVEGVWQVRLVSGGLAWSAWPLSETSLLVGRGLGCPICIEDPSISRIQCELFLKNGVPYLKHRSRHVPTLLNGSQCENAALKTGDLIEIAHVQLVVDYSGGDSPSVTNDPPAAPTTQCFEDSTFLNEDMSHLGADDPQEFASDLMRLFALQRVLANRTTLVALVEELSNQLPRRLGHGLFWFAIEIGDASDIALYPPATSEERRHAPMDALREALSSGEGGLFVAGVAGGVTVITAPLLHGNNALGAIAMTRPASADPFTMRHLHFLLAVAKCAAPLVLAAERTEQLIRDTMVIEKGQPDSSRLLGRSDGMANLRERLAQAASGRGNVLLLGETGVGKEIAARIIHDLSARSDGPYVTVNCAAIQDELFESEVFGHEKGAFTGATAGRRGLFEQAHGGTLFLDEVGELSSGNQARLLRITETNTFRRLGSEKDLVIDVRIVCATNRMLADGNESVFRRDLFYRLGNFLLTIPPLRDRTEDIEQLSVHFLSKFAPESPVHPVAFSEEALQCLRIYPWPGNVRELRNVIENACFTTTERVVPRDAIFLPDGAPTSQTGGNTPSLDFVERQHLLGVLKKHQGNVAKSAKTLGIAASTLYYKLRKHRISLKSFG